jgi:signal peptidase I
MQFMPNSIADHKISFLDLRMAPRPEVAMPAPAILPPAAAKRAARYSVGGIAGQIAMLVIVALLSVGCYWVISHYLVQTIEVVGESMVPTLDQGSHYLLNRTAYRQSPPRRGDVVVIRDPADHGFSVKRIIALEGESVHFFNGKVYVNAEPLSEPYLLPGTFTFTYSQAKEQMITCGKGQFFVLGDNRLVSIDSRSYGPVSRQDILGQVILHK